MLFNAEQEMEGNFQKKLRNTKEISSKKTNSENWAQTQVGFQNSTLKTKPKSIIIKPK